MSRADRQRHRLWCASLGLLVGAVSYVPAEAQAPPRPPGRDSVAADSARTDTAAVPATGSPQDTVRRADTVQAPLTAAELPSGVTDGEWFRWDRQALFASGALGAVDLLDRVPGASGFRSGWIASPAQATYLGDNARVRVFLDGLELDPLDPRTGGVLDLVEVPLWMLEDAVIERTAGELRLHLRTWNVRRTTPYTRTDVATGDEDTNLYRGFFGRRWHRGQALQLGGQQYGTTGAATTGGGDELALLGRVGWARRSWSIDAFASRVSRSRDLQQRVGGGPGLPALEAVRTDAYVRAGVGQPDSGAWAQIIAASMAFSEATEAAPPVSGDGEPQPSPDTSASRAQYVAAAGIARGALRLSATNRLRVFDRAMRNTVSARAAFEWPAVGLAFHAERGGGLRPAMEEASLRISPTSFLRVSGAVTARHDARVDGGTEPRLDLRAEGAIRLGQVWMGAGFMRRDSTRVQALRVYDTAYVSASEGPAIAGFGTLRGALWRDLGLDVTVVRWDARGAYRPQLQGDAALYVRTSWLGRFPSGNFGFLGAARYEYRSEVLFPGLARTDVSTWLQAATALLEIRVVDAVLFYRQQITLRRRQHEVVPGFVLPRQSVLYGVRWEFWN